MRASLDVVRANPALLWFPLASTLCLLLVTLFWIFEGAWLYAVSGPRVLFVPLVLLLRASNPLAVLLLAVVLLTSA